MIESIKSGMTNKKHILLNYVTDKKFSRKRGQIILGIIRNKIFPVILNALTYFWSYTMDLEE